MFMDDMKLFAKNEKELETLTQAEKKIQSGYRDGIWNGKMYHANTEKAKATNDGKNRTKKNHETVRKHGEKETYRYMGILEADTIKEAEMKEKR